MAVQKVGTITEYHVPLAEVVAALGLTVSRHARVSAESNGGTLIISVTENEPAGGGFHPTEAAEASGLTTG
jgi:hypothetical protein